MLLAMGFLKPEHPEYPENVFVCGDAPNGASLVVRAMASGIETAQKVIDILLKKNRNEMKDTISPRCTAVAMTTSTSMPCSIL